MKITVPACLVLLVLISDVQGAAVTGQDAKTSNSEGRNENTNVKRDSSDQTGVMGKNVSPNLQQNYHNNYQNSYSQGDYNIAAISPQISYAKQEGGIQYLQNIYKDSYITPSPQIAYLPHQLGVKYAAVPMQYTYPHHGPIQYAIAIGPMPGDLRHHNLAYSAAPLSIPYHGHALQFAVAPYSQNFGQFVKGGGIHQYAEVPQYAYIAAPSAALGKIAPPTAQSIAVGAPQQFYTYSIQPSIQIAAGKQILTPTVATPQYKHQIPPPTSSSYATFAQHLPVAAGVSPIKMAPILAQAVYPSQSAPAYPGAKLAGAYGSIAHAPQEPAAAYAQPSAIHYGTHLYHPSVAKVSPAVAAPKYP